MYARVETVIEERTRSKPGTPKHIVRRVWCWKRQVSRSTITNLNAKLKAKVKATDVSVKRGVLTGTSVVLEQR